MVGGDSPHIRSSPPTRVLQPASSNEGRQGGLQGHPRRASAHLLDAAAPCPRRRKVVPQAGLPGPGRAGRGAGPGDRAQAFLLELGHGFAFVGRQYAFTVGGDDFAIDLLFFNWAQSRFVVVELKVGPFAPEHLGQLGFYVSWVDGNLRLPDRHAPTIGILLCAGRNDQVVRYSLAAATSPMAVADYTYDTLPASARAAVPTDTELTHAVGGALAEARDLPDDDGQPPPGGGQRQSGGPGAGT